MLDGIRLNSIYSNGGLGIDLGEDGSTPDSPDSPHSGPDDFQSFPVLGSAIFNGVSTNVIGGLNSNANSGFLIDFFSNSALDVGATVQGRTYLGTEYVTTDATGNAAINASIATPIPAGQYLTATATSTSYSPFGDTSEFALPVQVMGAGGDPVNASPNHIVATEGSPFRGNVASFTYTNSSVTATINWGDGTPTTAGTIQSNGSGGFDVAGTHTYVAFGSYTTSVSITPANGSPATVNGTATIADAALSAASSPIILNAQTGVSTGNVVVGTFTDSDPNATVSDFTGSISFGDGTVAVLAAGNLMITGQSAAGVTFSITTSHTYTMAGKFTVAITVTDDDGNTATTGGSTTAVNETNITVASPPSDVLTPATTNLEYKAIEGNPTGRNIVGYFTDSNPSAIASDFIGSINWGDGNTTKVAAGDIAIAGTSSAGVRFAVYGNHTYIKPASYDPVVNITDDGGNSATTGGPTAALRESEFDVSDAPITGSTVIGQTAKNGKTFSGVVATFTDGDPFAIASDYQVTINWGDGHTTTVTPTYSSSTRRWSVSGSHVYSSKGTYQIVSLITDVAGQSAKVTSSIKVT